MSHTIELSQITVPSERWREVDPKRAEAIALSMMRFKQLQPIIVTQALVLVDGAHRYSACQMNGATTIEVVYRDEVDTLFLRELELEANIQRQEMSWQEQMQATAELHRMKVARDPSWGQAQTQELVRAPRQADISVALKLDRMMQMFPEIREAKSIRQALTWSESKAKSLTRIQDVKDSPADYSFIEQKIWHGDSVELIKRVPDNSFHAVITDPPFGINYDDRKEGTTGTINSYEDSEESYERLLSMAPDIYRVIKADGWLIWFLGVSWYERAKLAFRNAGFLVDEIPVVWDRSDGRAFTTRPDRYFGRAYDIALHCIKGNPQIIQRSKPNIIRIPPISNSERETLVERPVELYAELIRRLTVPNEVVADFFVGSGSCLAAAASLNRDFFGCELDAERRAYAITKVRAHIPDKKVPSA
jgi:DNA modification methylase